MGDLILPWRREYEDYLRDESRRSGSAESVSFPTTEAEVVEVVKAVGARGGTITMQGARTRLVAGAVPNGEHILNMSRMNRIGEAGEGSIIVQPGAILSDIQASAEPNIGEVGLLRGGSQMRESRESRVGRIPGPWPPAPD
jgi:D-lactate dehydrogenase (cytochrome)